MRERQPFKLHPCQPRLCMARAAHVVTDTTHPSTPCKISNTWFTTPVDLQSPPFSHWATQRTAREVDRLAVHNSCSTHATDLLTWVIGAAVSTTAGAPCAPTSRHGSDHGNGCSHRTLLGMAGTVCCHHHGAGSSGRNSAWFRMRSCEWIVQAACDASIANVCCHMVTCQSKAHSYVTCDRGCMNGWMDG